MRSKIFSIILIVSLVVLLTGCQCEHEWSEATCTNPKTCQVCNATEGQPLTHKWKEATCTEPKICELCNLSSGNSLGHSFPSDVFGYTYDGWSLSPDIEMQIIRCCTQCNKVVESQASQTDLNSTFNSAVSNGAYKFTPDDLMAELGNKEITKERPAYNAFYIAKDNSDYRLYPVSESISIVCTTPEDYFNYSPFLYFADKTYSGANSGDQTIGLVGICLKNYSLLPELCNSLFIDTLQFCAPHFDEATALIVLNAITEGLLVDKMPGIDLVFGSIEVIAQGTSDAIYINIIVPQ